jgi:hypothetical protein
MTYPSPSPLDKAQPTCDILIAEARTALTKYGDPSRGDGSSRMVAVYHLTTSAARGATARAAYAETENFTAADELNIAHLIIAELATRLAELEAGR